MPKDFENRFFDLLQGDVAELKADLKATAKATQDLAAHVATQNGRIGKLERKVNSRKIPFSGIINDKVLTLISLAAVILMIIIAYRVGAGELVNEIIN